MPKLRQKCVLIVVATARHNPLRPCLSKLQISQNGSDIFAPVGGHEPNGPPFVPSAVKRATTISPASMYSGLVIRPSENR